MTEARYADGTIVKKRPPHHPDHARRIGTIIKSELKERKRKGQTRPDKIRYYEVLWRGHTATDWLPQQRIEKVAGV